MVERTPCASFAWSILRPRIEQVTPTKRWRRVGGHIAAVITTLLDAGWRPDTARMEMDGTQCQVERGLISTPYFQLLQHHSAALCGNVPLDTGMGIGAEKDPITHLPPPRRVKPALVDLKAASEHQICENGNSLTCCRCGQRAPRRSAPLKRWLQSPCLVGHRITMSDGTHRMAPVEGQGRLRHQTTHASHNCTFYPSLDTWICLACGFYGSDLLKQLAQPCTGVSNQAGRDKLSHVSRGLMPGSSRAAREFNARRLSV